MTLIIGPHALTERDKWLEWRRDSLGASDTAAILGASPWTTPLQVYASKLGLETGSQVGEAAEWGHRLQGPVLEAFAERTGQSAVECEFGVRNPDFPWLHATPDGLLGDGPADEPEGRVLVQVKCTAYDWHGEVPPHVVYQVQQEMMVCRSSRCFVVVLFRGNKMEHFEVEADGSVQDHIKTATKAFWERIGAQEPPSPGQGDKSALDALFPAAKVENEDPIPLAGDLINVDEELQQVKEQLADLSGKKEALENQVRAALGEHAVGDLPNGVRYSWKNVTVNKKPQPASTFSFRALRRRKARS